MRERLLPRIEFTLAEAVKICHASELILQRAKTSSEGVRDADKTRAIVSGPTQTQRTGQVKRLKDKCKGQNHYARQCSSKGKQSRGERVHTIEETTLSDTFFVGMVAQEEIKPIETVQSEQS